MREGKTVGGRVSAPAEYLRAAFDALADQAHSRLERYTRGKKMRVGVSLSRQSLLAPLSTLSAVRGDCLRLEMRLSKMWGC